MIFQKLWNQSKKNNYLSPDTYMMMKKEGKKMMLLDVRTQSEYDYSHIPESYLVPVSHIQEHVEKLFPDKEMTYVIYCRSGIRSQTALKMMQQLGYNHVYDMGGIISWPYEVIEK